MPILLVLRQSVKQVKITFIEESWFLVVKSSVLKRFCLFNHQNVSLFYLTVLENAYNYKYHIGTGYQEFFYGIVFYTYIIAWKDYFSTFHCPPFHAFIFCIFWPNMSQTFLQHLRKLHSTYWVRRFVDLKNGTDKFTPFCSKSKKKLFLHIKSISIFNVRLNILM